ncbi:MAG: hypothetical protein RL132_463 [Pseudomonadota bacterium]
MYYDTQTNNHGMRYDPIKAIVGPRPIAWIGSVSPEGVYNLAPYSFFNLISDEPPMMMFSSGGRKDTQRNIEASGEFTVSLVVDSLRENMNLSSAAVVADVDEFALAGLTPVTGVQVKAPRVGESPVGLECRLWKTVPLLPPHGKSEPFWTVLIASIVGVHIDEAYIRDGRVDTAALQPVARLGYMDYTRVSSESLFTLNRPAVDLKTGAVRVEDKPWDGRYP